MAAEKNIAPPMRKCQIRLWVLPDAADRSSRSAAGFLIVVSMIPFFLHAFNACPLDECLMAFP
jgi:hypothetical protein